MKIGFIGAGKVGRAFGTYLKKNEFDILGYFSKTLSSCVEAANYINVKAYENISDLVNDVDVIFITTNDDEISKVCEHLVTNKLLKKEQILIHMSGASSSEILIEAKRMGCFIYSLHPLQSFANIDKAVEDLENTVFSLEGDEEKIEILEKILNKTKNKFFKINSNQKSLYHSTACIVSNYLVTLMDFGLEIFKSIGINKKEGFEALYPLIEGTIKNIEVLGTEKALTGPIARGDINTIKSHLDSLKNNKEYLKLYSLLGLNTLDLASKEKLNDIDKIYEMKNLFEEVL